MFYYLERPMGGIAHLLKQFETIKENLLVLANLPTAPGKRRVESGPRSNNRYCCLSRASADRSS